MLFRSLVIIILEFLQFSLKSAENNLQIVACLCYMGPASSVTSETFCSDVCSMLCHALCTTITTKERILRENKMNDEKSKYLLFTNVLFESSYNQENRKGAFTANLHTVLSTSSDLCTAITSAGQKECVLCDVDRISLS